MTEVSGYEDKYGFPGSLGGLIPEVLGALVGGINLATSASGMAVRIPHPSLTQTTAKRNRRIVATVVFGGVFEANGYQPPGHYA